MKKTAVVLALIAGTSLGLPTAARAVSMNPAVPGGLSYYSFTGTCAQGDCEGVGTGLLTLRDYAGGSLETGNFVSFTYSSSVLPSVVVNTVSSFMGALGSTSGSYDVQFNASDFTAAPPMGDRGPVGAFFFSSSADGGWCAECSFDYGPQHVWAAAVAPEASLPEPASWAMMIGGLAAVGAAMRRRKVTVRFA